MKLQRNKKGQLTINICKSCAQKEINNEEINNEIPLTICDNCKKEFNNNQIDNYVLLTKDEYEYEISPELYCYHYNLHDSPDYWTCFKTEEEMLEEVKKEYPYEYEDHDLYCEEEDGEGICVVAEWKGT